MSNRRKATRASVPDQMVKMSCSQPDTTLTYQQLGDWEVGILQDFNRRIAAGSMSCCVHLLGGPTGGMVGVYRPSLPNMLLCNDCADAIDDPSDARCDRCGRAADGARCFIYGIDERWPVALHAHLCPQCTVRAQASLA